MKKWRRVFAGLLIVFFCASIFTPAIQVDIKFERAPELIQREGAVAIDGDRGGITIPVWKNEQVLNSSPNTNHHGITNYGGLWVGIDLSVGLARSYLSFNLTHIPKETAFISARLHSYLTGAFTENDTAIGVYYCSDDTWDETLITWNNQPVFSTIPTDIIDSPESPDMFVENNWYSWDVTDDVRLALSGDKILTEVLRNVNENALVNTGKSFAKQEYLQFNATYLELSYYTPSVSDFAVDGLSSGPLLDYIQDETPIISWTHQDQDPNDFQNGYQFEVWNDQLYNDSMMLSDSSTYIQPVFHANASQNARPFATEDEVRFQFKYDYTIINRTGTVDKLHFYVVEDEGKLTLENLIVRIANVDTIGPLGGVFDDNFGGVGPTTVLTDAAYEAVIHDSILTIDVENTFVLNRGMSLIIELRFTGLVGTLAHSELDPTSSVGWVAYDYGAGDYTATTAGYLATRCHSFDIELITTELYNSPGSASGNVFPFATTDGEPGRVVWKYNNSLIQKSGYIDKLYFRTVLGGSDVTYENFEVYLCETPVQGRLANGTWNVNYGDVTPTQVLDESIYTVPNLGTVMVIDVDNSFYYNNEMDLLIEIRWTSKVSGSAYCLEEGDKGGYRAWYCHYLGDFRTGNDTFTYNMYADFVRSENEVEYSGLPLEDGTRYYSRIRICDSTGIWTSWSELSFKYEVLTSVPEYDGPVVTPSPVPLGSEVEIASNVTYFLGINQVLVEYDGSNHTMIASGDRYSYSWTPSVVGTVNFTIFMESAIGTWSQVKGSFDVLVGGLDPLMLLIIGGGIVVVLALVVVLKRKRGST
ncbi:MAG: DNRLRE domain-containing protein [Candidatus Thorarchaeota archaeon]